MMENSTTKAPTAAKYASRSMSGAPAGRGAAEASVHFGGAARFGTLAMEISLNPGVRVAHDARERIDLHLLVHDHADTIAGPKDGVQVVRDHHDRQFELALQLHDQLIE